MDRNKKAREKSKEVKQAELADFVNEQKAYRRMFLETTYKKLEMEETRIQIEADMIKIQWHGMNMPMKLAKAFYNLLVYNFREYAKELEGLKTKLKKKGMTDEQLVSLIENDKYVEVLK